MLLTAGRHLLQGALFLLGGLLLSAQVNAQTTLISPTGEGGFENGATFAANNWTLVNTGIPNGSRWFLTSTNLSTASYTFAPTGTRAAFISNNGGTNWSYTTSPAQTASSSHIYKDVVFPAGETNTTLSFRWNANGEGSGWDILYVYLCPQTLTPLANSPSGSLSTVSWSGTGTATLLGSFQLLGAGSGQNATINIPASALGNCTSASSRRLVFTWKNDAGGGVEPPAALDDVSLVCSAPVIPVSGGTYTINNTLPTSGSNFQTFAAAISAANFAVGCGALTGPITFNVSAGQTFNENVPVLTASGSSVANFIRFQKSGAGANPRITPPGTSGTSDFAFCVQGGDFITLDGIDLDASAVTAVEFGLLVRNATATNGAQNNTFQNMVINQGTRNGSSPSYCILQTVTSTGGGIVPTSAAGANSNNKYYNFTVTNVRNTGVYLLGVSSFPDLACEIGTTACAIRNTISNVGPTTSTFIGAEGIRTEGQSGVRIFNNNVITVAGNQSATRGIYMLANAGNSEVYRNSVRDVSVFGSISTTSSSFGIQSEQALTGTNNLRIYNNAVSNLYTSRTTASAIRYVFGIFVGVAGAASTQSYDVDNNTVSIGQGLNAAISSSCFEVQNNAAVYRIRGNIFANYSLANPTARHYAVRFTGATWGATGSVCNFNNYWIPTDLGTSGFISLVNTTNNSTLAAHQAALTGPGSQDVNSQTVDPQLIDPNTNLQPASLALNNVTGFAVQSWVTDDIDCASRGASPHDLGAYSITPVSLDMGATALAAPGTTGCFGAAVTVTVTIRNNGTSTIDFSVNPTSVTVNVSGAVTATMTATVNTGTLTAGSTQNVNMSTTLNMTTAGTYTFNAFTTLAGDGNAANNAMTAATRTVVAPVSLPQSVDFTSFTGTNLTTVFPNWREATGATAPSGTTSAWLNGSLGGASARINLNSNTRQEWIVGPRFTAEFGSQLKFKVAITDFLFTSPDPSGMQGTDDRVVVKVSTDCGSSYSDLFTFNAANTVAITNSLVQQTISLSAYAGQEVIIAFAAYDGPVDDSPDYDFHIDDILIETLPPLDMAATVLVTPLTSGCYGASETVAVRTSNNGSTAIDFSVNPVTVSVNVTGAVTASLTATVNTGTLAPAATLDVPMSTTLNMTTPGVYTFNGSVLVTGDGISGNDAMPVATRTVVAPVSLPQSVDFTGFTGANLTTVFPNWREATGSLAPSGTTSTWTNQGGWTPANTTARINLFSNTKNDWIVGPRFVPFAGASLSYNIAITDFNTLAADPSGMQGTDDFVQVRISTDCGLSWIPVVTWNAANTTAISNALVPQTFDLTPYAGQQCIMAFFASEGTSNDSPDYDFHIDNVSIVTGCAGLPNTGTSSTVNAPTLCAGTTVSLTNNAVNTDGGISYQWQVSNTSSGPYTNVSGGAGATTQSYTTGALSAGTYYYVLAVTCSGSSTTALSNELTVVVNPIPTPTVTPAGPVSFCVSGSLSSSASSAYAWSLGGGSGQTANITSSGSYAVTVTDVNGCQGTSTPVVVTVDAQPSAVSVSPTSPVALCPGGSVNFMASGGIYAGFTNSSVTSGAGGTTTVGNVTSPTLGPNPLQNYYGGAKVQLMWRASELAALGFTAGSRINSIAINLVTADATYTLQNFRVKTQWSSAIASLTTTPVSTGWANQFGPATVTPAVGFNTFVLSTPIIWNGTDNLLVEMNYSNNNAGTGGSTYNTARYDLGLSYTASTFYRVDNITAGAIDAYTGIMTNIYSGRNQVRFNVDIASPFQSTFSWSPGAGLNTTTGPNVTATLDGISQEYTVTATNGTCTTTTNVTINLATPLTAASITGTPAFCQGGSTTLTAVASGGGSYIYQWTGPSGPAGTASTQVVNQPGLWSVDITACGITQTASVNVIQNDLPAVTISPSPASAAVCNGAPVTLSATGGSSYTWSPAIGLSSTSGASVTATPTAAITYTVSTTDGNGCQGTATQTVNVGSNPTIGAVTATPDVVCANSSSQLNTFATTAVSTTAAGGAITIPSSGNSTPYPSTVNVSGLAGTLTSITVTLTNFSHSWPSDVDVALFGPTGAHSILFTDAIGGSGGIAGRTYTFQTGATALPTTGFPVSGTYGVVNGNAYSGTGTPSAVSNANLAIFNGTNPNGTWSLYVHDDFSSSGGSIGSWSITFNTTEPVTNFSWSPATFLNNTTISNPLASAITTPITYTATAASSIGCTAAGSISINLATPLTAASITGTPAFCQGGSTTLTAVASGGGSYIYQWTGPSGPAGTASTQVVNQPGLWSVDITACGITQTASVNVIQNDLPAVTISPSPASAAVCNGAPVTLSATGGSSYTWSPAIGLSSTSGASVTATPTAATTYTVSTTDGNGCQGTATQLVGVGSNPSSVSASASPSAICSGSTSMLSGSAFVAVPPSAYSLTSGSGVFTPLTGATAVSAIQADDVISSNIPIGFSFSYNGTSYTNVRASSNGFLTFNTSALASTAENNMTSPGTSIIPMVAPLWDDLSGATTGTASYLTTGTAPNRVFTFEWLNWKWNYQATGAVISFQARLFETSGQIEFIYRQEPTAYNAGTTGGASIGLVGGTVGNFLSLIGTGTNPGTSAVTETNNLASKPANGQVYTFLPPALSFSWQPSGQVVNPTSASTATVTLSSSQTYTLTASSNGCATTANVTVNLAAPLTAASITGTPSFCQGGSTTLTAVAAGGTGYTYQWTGPSGPAGTASTQVVNQPGAWSVDITACGITQTASVNVVQNALPAISISPAPASAAVCNGAPVTLTASGASTYTWSPATGLSGTAGAVVTATPIASSTYTVTGIDANGCQSTATQLVNVGQNPTASSVVSVTPLCAGSGTTITTTSSLNSFTISNNTGPISAAIPGTSLTGVFVDLPMSGGFGAIGASSSVRVTMSTAAPIGQNNTIDAYLVGPGNCGTLELTTDNGGTGINYSNAVFLTPGGGTNISTLSATNTSNITGTWSPEGSISAPPALNSGFLGSYSLPATALTGCPVNGTWRLFVAADGLMVSGTVTNFQLQLGLASTGNFTMSASGPGTIGAASYSGIENSVGAIDVTNIPFGTHVYTVTTTAPSGCSTTSAATVTAVAPPTTATVGGAQTICTNGITSGLGGNTPTIGTGAWSIVSGGTGTFSPDASTPNATFTHTSGSGPVVLRWTITAALCPPSSADVAVTVVSCNACAGVPAPGNTTTTASVVCPSTSFTLGTSIAQLSSGLNFVWQSGPGSAGPWTTMATTTSNTYMVTGQSVMTWYRVRVNCLNSGQTGIAAPVSVAVDPFCFPSPPSPALPGDTFISSSTVGTGTQSSTCGALAPGSGSIAGRYSSYLNQPALTSLVRGTNTAFSINVSDCENSGFGTSKVAIYVDLNQNDVFEVSEEVFEGLPAVTNYTSSGTFNTPLSAPLGSTGMRIIAAETGADITPTLVFNEGEVEDYVVNIINPAAANDFLSTAQSVTTGAFPTCGTSLTALLPVATNSPESAGAGNDVWYTFTAVTNGLRVAVTGGVAPHNTQIELRNAGGIIATENDQLTNGHETMILDNLTPGLQYWVAITQLAGSSNATVCIQHLRVSSCDNPSVFNSTCTSYKSLATGANTYAVTFDDNGVAPFVATAASTGGITTIPLGSFVGLPAPTSVANYLVRVDATYDLNDAAGNPVTVVVPGTFSCTRTVNPHPAVFLRDSDASPNVRPSNALIGANTWLCGASIYQWTIQQFTAVNGSPLAPLPTVVNGPPTNRFLDLFPLGLVPNGIYKVNVRPIFPSGPGNQGPDRWLIIAGPAMMGEQEEEGAATLKDGVEATIASALYPNPSNGSFVNLNITGVDANVMVRVLDGMGRVVWTSNLVVEGSLNTIIAFERPLASGLYMVEMTYDGQVVTERLMVQK